jgi:hypothetical protein
MTPTIIAGVERRINRGRSAPDAEEYSIQANAMDGVFFGGFIVS